ncbi:AAA family ATPase [Flavobacterium sp. NRK F10]|uniref:AAA family ATPase n=1 Tax=Flavobacterium sp. NRK F10 TaxID=2954931 RepID=UPI002091BCA8|nr:AAA family ATPase [Flavobacterium sp. NRK F10]MCO6173536.1 AAA family ATPase [Flavobacterium sp. NRK F10]
MEKLIVKNFGPIKEAEVDLTKYVIFIGDTSTGKSVLAKLIAIFKDSFFKLTLFKDVEKINFQSELKKYNIDFKTNKTEISLFQKSISNDRMIKVLELKDGYIVNLNSELKKGFLKIISDFNESKINSLDVDRLRSINKEELIEIFNRNFYNIFLNKTNSIYFPAERVLYSLTGNAISGLLANNIALPECYKEFAAKYEVARANVKTAKYNSFGLEYNFKNDLDEVKINNQKILLNEASSGVQSLVPLLLVLENELKEQDQLMSGKVIVIEEPELNLFPIKQKKIVNFLVSSFYDKSVQCILTTHSPYIVSSFDTLILAKNIYNEKPELKDEIIKIIPESNWVDFEEISVYEIKEDGLVYMIKDKEFKSIDVNIIDNVSDVISEEFDKLTQLRYE